MPNEQKQRDKAKVHIAKGEQFMDSERFKKAAEEFQKAAEILFELQEWKVAEQCFFYASKNLNSINQFYGAGNNQRLAANCALLISDLGKARDYYDIAAKSYLKSDAKDRYDMAAINISFAFLCYFLKGQQDVALEYVKRFKKELDPNVFANNLLIKLSRNLSNAIYNENLSYLQEILDEYPRYKFRSSEAELIKRSIIVAYAAVYMKLKIDDEKTEYILDQLITVDSILDYRDLYQLKTHPVLPYEFKSIVIKDMEIDVGDNLSVKEKPTFPIKLDLGTPDKLHLPIVFRTNFPGKGYIGPLMITIEVEGEHHFFLKAKRVPINIASPLAILSIEFEPLKTAVVNQSFPLQATIANKSDGEAVEIDLEMTFPEELRMIRGTFKKNIYSLRPNEEFKFELIVKALDAGEIPITTTINFKDPDGNQKAPLVLNNIININL